MKNIYNRSEIPCAEFLMSFQQGLLDDFIKHQESMSHPKHEDFILRYKNCRTDIEEEHLEKIFLTKKDGEWKYNADLMTGVGIKYDLQIVPGAWKPPANLQEFYPTATKLIEVYGDKCPNAGYSILPPQSIFGTHTDNEIIGKNYLRIHIPLIIPEGELFMIVGEEKVYWDNLFGFNGEIPHSAHNLSDSWRLIFLLDLEADVAGI